jgi:hypothetical protein
MIKRDSFPDILRGFALFGIAMVNIQFFSISTFDGAESLDLTQPESASVAFIVFALFQAKFYLVFSFLFGYSAHYVLKDHKSTGTNSPNILLPRGHPLYLRGLCTTADPALLPQGKNSKGMGLGDLHHHCSAVCCNCGLCIPWGIDLCLEGQDPAGTRDN